MCRTSKVSWSLVYKVLEESGYRIKTTNGSHLNLVDGANHNVTIPMRDVISPGSLLSISAQAGMEKEKLADLCLHL
jgi:predicted RNA binding protein YcfA (HicA-like mRNA interferase family)